MAPLGRSFVQHSVADASSTTLVVHVPLAVLEDELGRALPSARLEAVAGAPPGQHPVLIDLLRIERGHLAPGGLDLIEGAERLGALAGSMAGAFGALLGAAHGPRRGAALGARALQALAARGVERFGTYDEVLLALPHVVAGAGPQLLVLGMYTNSALSRWGERALGYGLGKQLAIIEHDGASFFGVSSPSGEPLIEARWSDAAAFEAHAPPLAPTWLDQPLLGVAAGAPVSARLERESLPGTRARRIEGRLRIERGVLGGLLAPEYALCAEASDAAAHAAGAGAALPPALALHTRPLRLRLSFPRRSRWAAPGDLEPA